MDFEINNIVEWVNSKFENDQFIIVGSKNKPWIRAVSTKPGGQEIEVEKGKDYIILSKQGDVFGGEFFHVNESEIKLIEI